MRDDTKRQYTTIYPAGPLPSGLLLLLFRTVHLVRVPQYSTAV